MPQVRCTRRHALTDSASSKSPNVSLITEYVAAWGSKFCWCQNSWCVVTGSTKLARTGKDEKNG